ncbi:MAG TPA: class I SAM-dependent methyltransferase [Nitrococcus sp.]|nr:class I SAM-dependent methyltransferase [Nitrococcus sp.]
MTAADGIAGILAITEESHAAARRLAGRLGATLLDYPPATGLYLACSTEGLWLRLRTGRRELAIRAELGSGRQAYRAERASPRGEAIARACGLPRHGSRHVVDATAGLGRDAHVLAQLGARVMLIEHSPVIFALLADAFDRAARHMQVPSWLERMHLIEADAAAWLSACVPQERPAVVYLDPMYPRRAKRAAPSKEMQVLQALLGTAGDETDSLLQAALRAASDRVVVKRPRHAEPLAGQRPDYQIPGRSTRFDVYLAIPE